MTLEEFKAWFEGFTEDMSGPPNEKQWKRIKKRVKEVDGRAVTERVYIDRYYRPYRPYWERIYWGSGSITSGGVAETLSGGVGWNACTAPRQIASQNSTAAMALAGRAEYTSTTG